MQHLLSRLGISLFIAVSLFFGNVQCQKKKENISPIENQTALGPTTSDRILVDTTTSQIDDKENFFVAYQLFIKQYDFVFALGVYPKNIQQSMQGEAWRSFEQSLPKNNSFKLELANFYAHCATFSQIEAITMIWPRKKTALLSETRPFIWAQGNFNSDQIKSCVEHMLKIAPISIKKNSQVVYYQDQERAYIWPLSGGQLFIFSPSDKETFQSLHERFKNGMQNVANAIQDPRIVSSPKSVNHWGWMYHQPSSDDLYELKTSQFWKELFVGKLGKVEIKTSLYEKEKSSIYEFSTHLQSSKISLGSLYNRCRSWLELVKTHVQNLSSKKRVSPDFVPMTQQAVCKKDKEAVSISLPINVSQLQLLWSYLVR